MRRLPFFMLTLLALLQTSASTQTTQQYFAEFTASTSHAVTENGVPILTKYELTVYPPGSTVPATVVDLGKPTPDASNIIRANVNTALAALPASTQCTGTPSIANCYTARVSAVGPGGRGDSALSPPFSLVPRAPAAPGTPAVIKM